MRLGLSTFACSWQIGIPGNLPGMPLSADSFLQKAKGHGFSLVQIADNLPLDHLNNKELHVLSQKAAELGIAVEVGTRGMSDEIISRYLEIARIFNSPLLRIVAAKSPDHPTREQILKTLKKWEPQARNLGIKIGLENHDKMSCKDLKYIMESIDSPFIGICLDTVNSFGALEGPDYVIEMLSKFVINIHLKDFRIFRPEHGLGFILEGTPAGEGQLDIKRLIENEHVKKKGDVTAILELWVPQQGTLSETIELENRWIGRSKANLDRLFEI